MIVGIKNYQQICKFSLAVSGHAKAVAKSFKRCTSVFGKCRKYEDDVGKALHACK